MRAALSLLDAGLVEVGELPERAAEVGKQCVLDWLGVTLAGVSEPLAEMLRAEAAPLDESGVELLISGAVLRP